MDATIWTVIGAGVGVVAIIYLEGAFSSKECCRIQDERHLKQAE